MAQLRDRKSREKEKIDQISEMIEEARDTDSLKSLNEYLRQLIMGPYGDTGFDIDEIKRQEEENLKWRKKSLRKRSKKNH